MIQYKVIDGLLLRDMAIAGSALLEKNREAVDALNVFPVPDGDTGTNMSLTMQSAIREINSREFLRADEAASALAKGALKGARGNSGVITSQLLRGFSKSLNGVEKINPVQFANAMKAGADLAYKAVMKPKEGTILTVARVMAEDALRHVQKDPDSFETLFDVIMHSGQEILQKTPEMLPVLKQANVVDSGGSGLMYIYAGYAAVLSGKSLEEILAESEENDGSFVDDHDSLDDVENVYCTNYSIVRIGDDCEETDIDSLRRRLNRIGNRVHVEGDLSCVKVHVHTCHPGSAIEDGLELGELVDLKIENIGETRRQKYALEHPEENETETEETFEEKEFGMVAVSLGDGFSQIFHDLSVDVIVEGGQTMNPSIDDILHAIKSAHAHNVFVFPNNGNVILAAQQAAALAEPCNVYVISTKNVAMGIAAAVAFQPDADVEHNIARMEEAAQHVRTATITYAVRDSEYNGIHITQGAIIGLHNGVIEYQGKDICDVAMQTVASIMDEESELVTVYYGAETSEEDAQELSEKIGNAYPNVDVECHRGGQPLYYYLISVE